MHTRSHRPIETAVDEADAALIRGNAAADAAAIAVTRVALPSEVAIRALGEAYRQATADLAGAACLLAQWPQLASQGKAVRKAGAAHLRQGPVRQFGGHRPAQYRSGWKCAHCGVFAFSLQSRCWTRVTCRPMPLHLEAAMKAGPTLGHALGMAEVMQEPDVEAANVLFCFTCGAFGMQKTTALGEPCARGFRSASTAARLRRILRGLHPTKAVHVSTPWKVLTPWQMRVPTASAKPSDAYA